MDLNKCIRCGCFYTSNSQVCPKCTPKENFELSKLKGYLEEHEYTNSINELSYCTGITVKNLNRFLNNGEFNDILHNLNNNN